MSKHNIEINDPKYKSYTSQVDKALKSFENTSEWADLIAALGKLNKVLNAHSKFTKIPKKVLIGKRLAQCLHPSLPNGVHLKALETYDIIFKCIGPHELSLDIFIYSCGLFPLLSYAAINVRPVLLSIYENHFIPLKASIRPAMTGLLMGLLPGFENASEYFDRMHQLLESFSECVDRSYFYTCMWECINCNSSVRYAGLNFIILHFDKKQSMEDQIYLMGTNISLLVQALCLSLEDSTSLVQRCVLDLLISCFPIHNCQLPRSDILKVLTYAITILLRRDMSLNRRLNAWLMGTDLNGMSISFIIPQHLQQVIQQQQQQGNVANNSDSHSNQIHLNGDVNYFNLFTKDLLILAVRSILNADRDSKNLKQYSLINLKTMISLLDRPEIISTILNDLLLDILRTLYRECHTNLQENVNALVKDKISFSTSLVDESFMRKIKIEEKQAVVEVYKTANILFAKFDPRYIWNFIAKLFDQACRNSIKVSSSSTSCEMQSSLSSSSPPLSCHGSNVTIKEFVDIVTFLLDKLSLEAYFETNTQHFPNILTHVILTLQDNNDLLSNQDLISSLKLCIKVLTRVISYCDTTSVELFQMKTNTSNKINERFASTGPADDNHAPVVGVMGKNNKATRDAGDDYDADDVINDDDDIVGKVMDKQFINNNNNNDNYNGGDDGGNENDDADGGITGEDGGDADNTTNSNNFVNRSEILSNINDKFVNEKQYANEKSSIFTFIDIYLTFFKTIVEKRIIPSCNFVNASIEYLFIYSNKIASWKDYQNKISKLMKVNKTDIKERLEHEMLLKCTCDLLSKSLAITTYDVSFEDIEVPSWFQTLLCLCLFAHDFSVQYISLNCMFQLIYSWSSSTKSSSSLSLNGDDNDDADDGGSDDNDHHHHHKSSYHQAYLTVLNDKTCFYKLTGGSVWSSMMSTMMMVSELGGSVECNSSLKMVELFNNIHQHAPHAWICEDVVTEGMFSRYQNEKVTSTMQFINFWQRLKEMDTSVVRKKTFEKAIVILLDDLDSDNQVCSSLAKQWLISCVKGNELTQILEPVFKVLLHPDTARISVQQLDRLSQQNKSLTSSSQLLLQQSDQQDHMEPKIVAVSNEGGNIMYHLDSTNRFKPSRIPSSMEDCHALALTTLSNEGSSTKKAAILLDNYLSSNRSISSHVTLRVNPFGSTSSDDESELGYIMKKVNSNCDRNSDDLSSIAKSAKRLNKETCKKEEIIFEESKQDASICDGASDADDDDRDCGHVKVNVVGINDADECSNEIFNETSEVCVSDDVDECALLSSQDVVCEIIEDIIEELFNDDIKEQLKELSSSCDFTEFVGYNDIDNDNLNAATNNTGVDEYVNDNNLDDDAKVMKKCFEQLSNLNLNNGNNTNNNRVNSLRSYVLLYLRQYDSTRILYVLKLFKSLILTEPKLVIQSLIGTTFSSVNKSSGMQQNSILNLYMRHKQSIMGHEFHATLLYDSIDNHANNSTYLELVISILLYFIRSYYPCNNNDINKLYDSCNDINNSEVVAITSNINKMNTSNNNINHIINSARSSLMMADRINVNKEVHICCCNLLKIIFNELTKLIRNNVKAAYSISELLIKSKVQKTILYSIYSNLTNSDNCNMTIVNNNSNNMCLHNNDDPTNSGTYQNAFLSLVISLVQLEDQINLTKAEPIIEQLPKEFEQISLAFCTSNTSIASVLTNRPHHLGDSNPPAGTITNSQTCMNNTNDHQTSNIKKDVLFVTSQPVIYQPILLQAIIHSLSQSTDEKIHIIWIDFIHQLMPHLSKASTKVLTIVLMQLCTNIERCQSYVSSCSRSAPHTMHVSASPPSTTTITTPATTIKFSPDYYSHLINHLTSIYHFCLFDSLLYYSARHQLASDAGQMGKIIQTFSGQLVSGLVSAFTFQGSNKNRKINSLMTSSDEPTNQMELCNNMLTLLPNIVTTTCSIWVFLTSFYNGGSVDGGGGDFDDDDGDDDHRNITSRVDRDWAQRMKLRILDLLNPIANNHQHSLLTSLALLWNDNMTMSAYEDMVNPPLTQCHLTIIEIICQLKHVTFNSLMITIKQIIKQPTTSTTSNSSSGMGGGGSGYANKRKYVSLEASLLQMLHAYMKQLPDSSLVEFTTPMITFIKEVFQANVDHTAIFVLISILHCLLQKGPVFEERREHKDIHDITYKLLEACSNVAGLSLEQANFFRRHLAVKSDIMADDNKNDDVIVADEQYKVDGSTIMMTSATTPTSSSLMSASSTSTLNGFYQNSFSQSQPQLSTQQPQKQQPYNKSFNATTYSQSVQGLYVLADVTATLLDVAFQSDEKDKVTPLLSNILSNVFPYLKNHRLSNSPSYTASSKLLSNLSGYQYTRKCWRKECMDLMLDSNFFQMNFKSLHLWTVIVDNLMSHDKSSFLDLLARFSLAQSSSLNLFASRDFESEQRRQLIKRLSFTIFCSEVDQYQKSMPDIQEKLSDCLRFPNSPGLHAEVFSCFRVLVLRMSSLFLTSIWPTMITELIQVFVDIEQKLTNLDPDENIRNYKTTDSLVDTNGDKTNLLYLSACKLLDLFITMPHENLQQFQLYKWAFIAESTSSSTTLATSTITSDHLERSRQIQSNTFTPHVVKISKLMQSKFGQMLPPLKCRTHQLTLTNNRVTSLRDLQEFFVTISSDTAEDTKTFKYDLNPTSTIETSKHSTIMKSKSYPNFTANNPTKNQCNSDVNPIETIEQIVLNDFLEKMT